MSFRAFRLFTLIALTTPALVGCASIVEGTSQTVSVNTTPDGASCEIQRKGAALIEPRLTPFEVKLSKTKHDLTVICEKPGYERAELPVKSEVAAATFGNILIWRYIGWGVDSALGADNKYEPVLNIPLVAQAARRP